MLGQTLVSQNAELRHHYDKLQAQTDASARFAEQQSCACGPQPALDRRTSQSSLLVAPLSPVSSMRRASSAPEKSSNASPMSMRTPCCSNCSSKIPHGTLAGDLSETSPPQRKARRRSSQASLVSARHDGISPRHRLASPYSYHGPDHAQTAWTQNQELLNKLDQAEEDAARADALAQKRLNKAHKELERVKAELESALDYNYELQQQQSHLGLSVSTHSPSLLTPPACDSLSASGKTLRHAPSHSSIVSRTAEWPPARSAEDAACQKDHLPENLHEEAPDASADSCSADADQTYGTVASPEDDMETPHGETAANVLLLERIHQLEDAHEEMYEANVELRGRLASLQETYESLEQVVAMTDPMPQGSSTTDIPPVGHRFLPGCSASAYSHDGTVSQARLKHHRPAGNQKRMASKHAFDSHMMRSTSATSSASWQSFSTASHPDETDSFPAEAESSKTCSGATYDLTGILQDTVEDVYDFSGSPSKSRSLPAGDRSAQENLVSLTGPERRRRFTDYLASVSERSRSFAGDASMDWDGKTTIKASRQGSAEPGEAAATCTTGDEHASQTRAAPLAALTQQLSLILREPTSVYNLARYPRAVLSYMLQPLTRLYAWGHFFVVLSIAIFFTLQRGPSVLRRSRR